MTDWIQLKPFGPNWYGVPFRFSRCDGMRVACTSLLLRYLYHMFVSLVNEVTKPGLDTVFSFTPFMAQPCCLNCVCIFFILKREIADILRYVCIYHTNAHKFNSFLFNHLACDAVAQWLLPLFFCSLFSRFVLLLFCCWRKNWMQSREFVCVLVGSSIFIFDWIWEEYAM